MKEPVPITCPDIDALINTLTSCVKDIRSVMRDNKELDKDVVRELDSIADTIEETYHQRWKQTSPIESLRHSNSELRHWGVSLAKILEQNNIEI